MPLKTYAVRIFNSLVFSCRGIKRFIQHIPYNIRRLSRLYVKDQITYIKLYSKSYQHKFRPTYTSGIIHLPCIAISETDTSGLCHKENQLVITERQFAYTKGGYLAHAQGLIYASSRRLFPQITLYDINVDSCLGIMAYNHSFYYHDLVDLYFQAFRLNRLGYSIPVLQMEIPKSYQKNLEALMSQLGIKVIWLPSRLCRIRVKNYYTFTAKEGMLANSSDGSNPALYEIFKDYIASLESVITVKPSSYGKKIYSTRRNASRDLENRSELEEFFANQGFEIVNFADHTIEEQVNILRNADTLAGPHGANLTNLIFMPSGSKVIELLPPKKSNAMHYSQLSTIFNHAYHQITLEGHGRFADVRAIGKNVINVLNAT